MITKLINKAPISYVWKQALIQLFGNTYPTTYLSLMKTADANNSFYQKVTAGSFLTGLGSIFSDTGLIKKISLVTGSIFGTVYGTKGMMSSTKAISIYKQAHEATKSSEYLATSNLDSLTYITAVDKNGLDKFTGKYLEGKNGKIISNEMTRIPTLAKTIDGKGFKHDGGYTLDESEDRIMYKKIPNTEDQYTNELVSDASIIDLHSSIIQQLVQKGYSNEDIEKALSLGTAEKRESYLNEQLKNYKPGAFAKLCQGTEKAIQNRTEELLKEVQKYAEINEDYEALNYYHTSSESEEMFYSLDSNINITTTILGVDEGYCTDSDIG